MIRVEEIALNSSRIKLTLSLITSFVLLFGSAGIESSGPALAQPVSPYASSVEDERGIVALDQALREITNPFTIVCVAARPGDEDDGALALLRKKLGARTVMLFATRGEGEASPRFPELDAELGVVHTREAIEAARVVGSDVLFLNLRDPGYSKSAEEVLSGWGRDEALRRFIRAYRSLRPDVIITRHDPKGGEGVEQAAARLAFEAVAGAADPKAAPEAGFEAWHAERFFRMTAETDADVAINLNEYDRVRGRTYAQIGMAARNRFVSRGRDSDRLTTEGEKSFYKLLTSASDERLKRGGGLLDGIGIPENVTRSIAAPRLGDQRMVDAIGAGERLIDGLLEKLIEKRAEGTPADLHERYGAQFVRVVRFTAAIERAIALALGLDLKLSVSDRIVVPGQKLVVRVALRNGGARAFPVVFSAPERLPSAEDRSANKYSEVQGLGVGNVVSQEFEFDVAKNRAPSLPTSAHLYDEDYYAVGSSLPGSQPAEPFGVPLILGAEVGLGQASIRVASLARFHVAPPVEISSVPFALVRDWSKTRDFEVPVRVRNRTPGALAGALWVVPLALSQDEYEPVHIAFAREDQEITATLKLRLPILKPPLAPEVLIEFRREKPSPPDPLGSAKILVKAIDFDVASGLRVGYITGPADWLALALVQLGVEHRELKVEEISSIEHGNEANQIRPGCADLSIFDAIIIDEDAYFARRDLILQNRCLLRYARQGGNLVVLAQRADDWNLALSGVQFAPYPIKLSKYRLASETARVKILDAEHTLSSKPNQITPKDFEGWIVERAMNVPREWSPEYLPLLESSDPGEEPSRGALLVARYGEGTCIFTSLSLRRQLSAGNGGAYRLFANLVSLSKIPKPPSKPQ